MSEARDMRLGVTLGDPAGVGPEVTEAAVGRALRAGLPAAFTLIGPVGIADVIAARLGEGVGADCREPFTGPPGQPSAASGRAALSALERGIELARAGELDALVTAPLCKEALAMSGSDDRGHTEILARGLGAGGPVAMAFFSAKLSVVLATAHVPLREALASLSAERVVEVTRLFHAALARLPRRTPPPLRLALAGLNPHAGEAGLLGREEQTLLCPAVAVLRSEGIDISEPLPPDTVFRRAVEGEYDGVVALYHDQALIPVKLLAFGQAVNVTLGLRVTRTSPDHGTAYDRVGTGTACSDGMLGALQMALQLGRAEG